MKNDKLEAVQHIRLMRGGSQSHLLLCSDDNFYVTKFKNNPQSLRVLANDFLATNLATTLKLNVPRCTVLQVKSWLIDHTPELVVTRKSSAEKCQAGLQFGSRYVGGSLLGRVIDYLPVPRLLDVKNLAQFAGILVLDKWTCNADGRQSVFFRTTDNCIDQTDLFEYVAYFVDQGHCFNAGAWTYEDLPLQGVFPRYEVYAKVTGWDSFEPWLTRAEEMDASSINDIAMQVPREWLDGAPYGMDDFIDRLLRRRPMIRHAITAFRKSGRNPFPNWLEKSTSLEVSGRRGIVRFPLDSATGFDGTQNHIKV